MITENEVKIKVTIYKKIQWDKDWPPDNATLFIAWFNEKLKTVPVEYRNSAQICAEGIFGYDKEPKTEIEIFYYRNLTIEETAKIEVAKKKDEQAIEECEIKELKRLADKYRGKISAMI